MPFVNIKMLKSDKGQEAKERLIEGVTRLLQEIYDKPPEVCSVLIEEYEAENWGMGGCSFAKKRAGK